MNAKIIIIIISVICGVGLIAAIGLFFFCRKRREKKKENMANAFFEFSADKPDDLKKSKSPGALMKKFQSSPVSTL
jgi:flagellar basal body-associated protein FliL